MNSGVDKRKKYRSFAIMFQCKDLLTLPSMAKARIIAGKSGLSNRIRWVYKPENMNFAKWVKGQEF